MLHNVTAEEKFNLASIAQSYDLGRFIISRTSASLSVNVDNNTSFTRLRG